MVKTAEKCNMENRSRVAPITAVRQQIVPSRYNHRHTLTAHPAREDAHEVSLSALGF